MWSASCGLPLGNYCCISQAHGLPSLTHMVDQPLLITHLTHCCCCCLSLVLMVCFLYALHQSSYVVDSHYSFSLGCGMFFLYCLPFFTLFHTTQPLLFYLPWFLWFLSLIFGLMYRSSLIIMQMSVVQLQLVTTNYFAVV
jgi:hypothetical protein